GSVLARGVDLRPERCRLGGSVCGGAPRAPRPTRPSSGTPPGGARRRGHAGGGRRTPTRRRHQRSGFTPAYTLPPPMTDFTGRVAIITGAARGLGRAAAERLHEVDASVAVNVRDRVRAESLAGSIGERALAVSGDIAAPGVPEEIVRLTLERFGRVDILINNAALARSTRFPDLTADEWRQALEVNLTAPFLLTKAVLPVM